MSGMPHIEQPDAKSVISVSGLAKVIPCLETYEEIRGLLDIEDSHDFVQFTVWVTDAQVQESPFFAVFAPPTRHGWVRLSVRAAYVYAYQESDLPRRDEPAPEG